MHNAYNKLRTFSDGAVALQTREQKFAACEKRRKLATALQEHSLTILVGMHVSFSLTSRMWTNDTYSIFSVKP